MRVKLRRLWIEQSEENEEKKQQGNEFRSMCSRSGKRKGAGI
jgi:hypothetical protein